MKKWISLAVVMLVIGMLVKLSITNRGFNEKPVIAIATLMSHPALDAVLNGALTVLEENGYSEKTAHIVVRNAQNQMSLTASIISELMSRNPAVLIAVTTPMAQAAAKQRSCPVVFAAVTDPVSAGVIPTIDLATKGITGTSDAWPYASQLELIREISPAAKRVGVLFNPGESASQYGIMQIRKLAPNYGFEIVEGPVSSTGDIYPVALALAKKVDVFFLSSDNTVTGGASGAVKVAFEQQIPLYAGDSGTVKKGALAAVSVGYYELGRETGRMAVRFLKGEAEIIPYVGIGTDIYLNTLAAKKMGVEIPVTVLDRATSIIETIE